MSGSLLQTTAESGPTATALPKAEITALNRSDKAMESATAASDVPSALRILERTKETSIGKETEGPKETGRSNTDWREEGLTTVQKGLICIGIAVALDIANPIFLVPEAIIAAAYAYRYVTKPASEGGESRFSASGVAQAWKKLTLVKKCAVAAPIVALAYVASPGLLVPAGIVAAGIIVVGEINARNANK